MRDLPYDLNALTWIDDEHSANAEDCYCYCGGPYSDHQAMTHCSICRQLFHAECIECLPNMLLFGDNYLIFECAACRPEESYRRENMSWVTVVHLVLYNLIQRQMIADRGKPTHERHHLFFRWKDDICKFIDDYWDYLVPGKTRSATWHNTIASVLSTHGKLFKSGYEKFQQSAWWSLFVIEPPSKPVKGKAATKPKKKRSLAEPSASAAPKKIKQEKRSSSAKPRTPTPTPTPPPPPLAAVKREEPIYTEESIDFGAVSDLSSDFESASDTDTSRRKPANDAVQKDITASPAERKSEVPFIKQEEPSTAPKEVTPPVPNDARESLVMPDVPEETLVSMKDKAVQAAAEEEASKIEMEEATPMANKRETDEVMSEKRKQIAEEGALPSDTVAKVASPTTKKSTGERKKDKLQPQILTQQQEWQLLQKLEHSNKPLPVAAARYKRKLAVRRMKRNLHIKLFDMDAMVNQYLKSKSDLVPIAKETLIKPAANQLPKNDSTRPSTPSSDAPPITFTPYASSFASRLYGNPRCRHTLTRDKPWLSLWTGRKLRPYIRRDYESRTPKMQELALVRAAQGKPRKQYPAPVFDDTESIDYVYFQPEHLAQANALLRWCFWDGIDVSENLQFPEFSIVALYKRCVVACAFMTPEAYITYIAVRPGWDHAGIGQFMLYHLFQTAINKDITLHVSANNTAMILYQKFGFKPEEFIVDFYDKYLPADSIYSKNAFFLRLRRT